MGTRDYTAFNNVDNVGEVLLMSQLESNLKTYFDWSFLGIGAFGNVNIPTSGAYGGTYDRMRAVDDPSYTDGQVWETARKDWVWETGVERGTGEQPIDISGVYIAGTLYTTGDATFGHHYNYPLGRVVFDTAIAQTSTVQIEHSYRNVQMYVADQAPWWDELQYNSHRVDDSTFHDIGSGNWQILGNSRVQMPAIVVEAVPRRQFKPYQQGSVGQYVYQDVYFHVLAESRWWRNQLLDIVSLQKDRTIWLYDNNTIPYSLDHRGMRSTDPTTYPDLVESYRWKMARFYNMVVTEMNSYSSRLHQGTVRATFEIVIA